MPLFAKPASDVDETFEDPNKRAKIMLIVLAGVVAIAALFWFLVKPALTKSDSNKAAAGTSAPSATVPGAPAAPSARPTVKPKPSPTASFLVNDSTRDPFAPLAFEVKATTAPSPSVAPPPSASPSATPSAAPSSSSAAAPTSHTLTLLSVTGDSASLTVDGKTTDAKAGSTVASGVSLVKVTDDAIFVTFNSKAYAITIGQTVSV